MKKIFVLLVCLLGIGTQMRTISGVCFACEPPTPHGVIYGGCNLLCSHSVFASSDFEHAFGGFGSIGFEDSRRYVISSVQYRYGGSFPDSISHRHDIGMVESINIIPMWLFSPINLHVLAGGGGSLVAGTGWKPYASIGGEVSFGVLHSYVQFFCRYEYVYTFGGGSGSSYGSHFANVGFKFMLGKDW